MRSLARRGNEMATALSADLSYEDLRAGWQKVCDNLNFTAHIFRLPDGRIMAVTNQAQGLGELVETIRPGSAPAAEPIEVKATHGRGAIPGRTEHEGTSD